MKNTIITMYCIHIHAYTHTYTHTHMQSRIAHCRNVWRNLSQESVQGQSKDGGNVQVGKESLFVKRHSYCS